MKRSNALHVNYSRATRNTFHNSSLHILNIQVFLAIDENLHVAVGLQNEVSKGAMHAGSMNMGKNGKEVYGERMVE